MRGRIVLKRRNIALLCLVFLIASFAMVLCSDHEPLYDIVKVDGNLLLNPGFEESFWNDNLPDYWTPLTNWAGETIYGVDSKIKRSGRKSVSMKRRDDKAGAFQSNKIDVGPGEFYYVGGFVKTTNVGKWASIMCRVYDSNGSALFSGVIATATNTSEWQGLMKKIKIPTNGSKMDLLLALYGDGEAYFDDVFITKKEPEVIKRSIQSVNILLNSSFEEADFNRDFVDCFELEQGKGILKAKQTVERSYHGNYALEIDFALGPNEEKVLSYGSANTPSIILEPDTKYYAHLAVFLEKGAPEISVRVPVYNQELQTINIIEKNVEALTLGQWNEIDFSFIAPNNAYVGEFQIVLKGGGSLLLDSSYLGTESFDVEFLSRIMPIIEEAERPENLPEIRRVEVKPYNGTPTIFIDEKPATLVAFNPYLGSLGYNQAQVEYQKKINQYGRIQLYVLTAYYTPEETGEEYTFFDTIQNLEFQMKTILSGVPDAYFVPYLVIEPTKAFAREFPDETIVIENNDSSHWSDAYTLDKSYPRYTYASEVWARKSMEGLKKIIYYLRQQEYGGRIIGILSGMGVYGEHNWGGANHRNNPVAWDFSPAMYNYFRKWLFQDYDYDVVSFNKAWGRRINFSSAEVPFGYERIAHSYGEFYHPQKDRRIVDYYKCDSYVIGHRVIDQGRAIKDASDGDWLSLFMFSYLTGNFQTGYFSHVLDSPYVDGFSPAPPYINRGAGDDPVDHFALGSIYANNKIWFAQDDTRTHLSGEANRKYGTTANARESVAVLKREVGHHISTGANPFFMTFGSWYDDYHIWETFKKFDPLFRLGAKFDRKSNAEIAVVMHQDSLFYNGGYNYVTRQYEPRQSLLEYNRILELSHIGAQYDYYELNDLLKSDSSQYKLIIMLNCFALTEDEREQITTKLCNNNRSIVWLYAPGIINPDSLEISKENVEDLIGINLSIENQEKLLTLTISNEASKFGLTPGNETGKFNRLITTGITNPPDYSPIMIRPEIFNPRIVVDDNDVVVLGRYKDGGKPGFAMKRMEEYKSIFFGSTALTSDVIRALAQDAGVNLYTEKEAVVYANKHFLMVHVNEGGSYKITLPSQVEMVKEIFDQEIISENVKSFVINFEPNDTRVFFLGNREEFARAKDEVENTLCFRFKEWDDLRERWESLMTAERKPLGKAIDVEARVQP
jgi:hypothetical protein